MDFTHTNLPVENEFPKLVRDNIPQIIKQNDNKEPQFSVANDDRIFLHYLLKKMVEESIEVQFHKNKENLIEELADVKELTIVLMQLLDITDKDIEKVRKVKKEKNGGFEKRFILEAK